MGELTLKQEKFVQVLTTPNTPQFCNPTAAYKAVSPSITYGSQRMAASRLMAKDHIQQAIRGQMDIGQMGSKLKKCLRAAEQIAQSVKEPTVKLSAYREQRDTLMDYARLTGQLTEKREVTTLTSQDSSAISQLVARSMRATSPSLRMTNSDGDEMGEAPVSATLTPSATTRSETDASKCTSDTKSGPPVARGAAPTPPDGL